MARSTEHPPQAVPSSRLLSDADSGFPLSCFSLASQILDAFVAPVSNCKALHLSHIPQQQLAQVSLFILNTLPRGNTANISDCWGLGHGEDAELTSTLSASLGIAVLLNPIPGHSIQATAYFSV